MSIPRPVRTPTPPIHHSLRRGFSLIELLVVIAVIALLLGILLPSLRKARLEGWKTVSLANLRSIGSASMSYQYDNKDQLPIVPNGVPVSDTISAWVPFTSWGKFASSWWTKQNGLFDISPADRPLNPYLFSQPLPLRRQLLTNPNIRKTFQLPVFRDPSDKIGHQQNWNSYSSYFGEATENPDFSSCYDDVGTSYLWQCKWFFQTSRYVGGDWTKTFRLGSDRLRVSGAFDPSRMIFANDEYCDITINQVSDKARIKNGYGDINKAAVLFLDGHARYLPVIPGGESDPRAINQPWLVPAYSNRDYTVVFPDLR